MEYFFISKLGDEVVGYVQAVADGPGTLRIMMSRLAVEWHHTSIPASLLDNVHDFCCRSGFSNVVLAPGAFPRVSLRVLQRCGFRPRGTQGGLGRSLFEYAVTAKTGPGVADAVGDNRDAEPALLVADAFVAGRRSPRSQAGRDRSGHHKPR